MKCRLQSDDRLVQASWSSDNDVAFISHDYVMKWKHFPRYWPLCGEINHKGQWRGALMFSLICAWTNHWINKRLWDAGDLRPHRAHANVTVKESKGKLYWPITSPCRRAIMSTWLIGDFLHIQINLFARYEVEYRLSLIKQIPFVSPFEIVIGVRHPGCRCCHCLLVSDMVSLSFWYCVSLNDRVASWIRLSLHSHLMIGSPVG